MFNGDSLAAGTNAGTYEMQLHVEDFINMNPNFTNVEFVIIGGTLQITKRSVTLASGSDSKEYDGTALTKPGVTVGGDGFVAGDSITAEAVGTITEIGTVVNEIAIKVAGEVVADLTSEPLANYEISKEEGELEITASTKAL